MRRLLQVFPCRPLLTVALLAVALFGAACGADDGGGDADGGQVDATPQIDAGPNGLGSEPRHDVLVNEVAPLPASGEDWIELTNRGAATVDISGWFITDWADQLPHFYTFPAGTTIAPGAYLIVWADHAAPGLPGAHHAPFALGHSDSVQLLDPDGVTIDGLLFLATEGHSLQRIPDHAGLFYPAAATPAAENPAVLP